jgi:hypothetical protein
MRARNVVLAESLRVTQRQLKHLLRSRRERDVTVRLLLAATLRLPDPVPGAGQADTDLAESDAGRGVVMQQPEQQMLGADLVMPQQAGLFLGVDDDATRVVSESLEHETSRSR